MSIPNRIARLNTNGTTDTSFNPGLGLNAAGECVAVLNDGRIMAGGQFSQARSTARARLVVFNADGTLDAFALGADATIHGLAVQTDGKVLIGGDLTAMGGTERGFVARLTSLLALEAAYNPGANASLYAIANRADGKTMISGSFTEVGGEARQGIARLHNDAADAALTVVGASLVQWLRGGAGQQTVRVTFELDTGGGYSGLAGTITRITGGWQIVPTTPLSGAGTIRARAYPEDSHSGGIHEALRAFSFVPEIEVTVNDVLMTDAVSTLAYGSAQLGTVLERTILIRNLGLADLTLTGGAPVTLSGTHAAQWSILAQPSSPVLPGQAVSFMLRFTPAATGSKTATLSIASDDADESPFTVALTGTGTPGPGSLDTSWTPVLNSQVLALAVQPADMLLVGGHFTTVNGVGQLRWARLDSAGLSPSRSGSTSDRAVFAFAHLPTGKWLVAAASTVNSTKLWQILSTGAQDTGFNVVVSGGDIYAMALQTDGKVILSGTFTSVKGVARTYLARLNTDGTVDTSWTAFASSAPGALVTCPDGKLYVAHPNVGVQRLLAAGAVDSGFSTVGVTQVEYFIGTARLLLQPDGKLLIGCTGADHTLRILRLTTAGAVDGTFTTITGHYLLALQTDGKVLYYDPATGEVKRALSTGAADTSFTGGSAILSAGRAVIDSQGRIYVTSAGTVQRLVNDATASQALTIPSAARVQWLRSGASTEIDYVTFEVSEDGTTWTWLGVGARISGGWELTGLSLPIAGTIRARARCGSGMLETTQVFSGLLVPDLDVTRLVTGAADVSVADGGSVAFAGVQPTQTADVTLKLRNSGLATLTGLTLTMTGAEFSVISLDLTSLEPGQVATAIIRCTPSATGVRTGVLDITSNVPGTKAVYRVALTGYGITNPAAITDAATLITSGAARLPVRVTANADVATAYVRYRRAGTADAWTLSPVPAWDIAGFTVVPLYRDIGSLSAATSYEFQAIAINAVSTKEGTLRTFSTLP